MTMHTPILVVRLSVLSVLALEINANKAIEESYRLVVAFETTRDHDVLQSDQRLQGARIVKGVADDWSSTWEGPLTSVFVERLFWCNISSQQKE